MRNLIFTFFSHVTSLCYDNVNLCAFYCVYCFKNYFYLDCVLFCLMIISDKTKYKIIIIGIASNLNNRSNKADSPKKSKPTLLSLSVLFFVFKENNLILAFMIKALNTLMPTNTYGLLNISIIVSLAVLSVIIGILNIKSALAGVGKPIKLSVWRVSTLNFAKRIADPNVIKKPK